MANGFWTAAMLLLMTVVSVAAVFVVGTWTLAVTAIILLLLVAHVLSGQRGGVWWGWGAVLLGLLGGLVGAASALAALASAGDMAGAGGRAGFGWAALVLAAVAAAGATLVRRRPRLSVIALVAGSSLGIAAMSLFDINTFYVAAVPLCWIAAVLALLGARPPGATEPARV